MRASAGTRSPERSRIKSPGTSSVLATLWEFAVADHLGRRRRKLLERGQGALGAVFLDKAQDRIEDDDPDDGDGVEPFLQKAGDDRGGDQDEDDKVGELFGEDGEWRTRLDLRAIGSPRTARRARATWVELSPFCGSVSSSCKTCAAVRLCQGRGSDCSSIIECMSARVWVLEKLVQEFSP